MGKKSDEPPLSEAEAARRERERAKGGFISELLPSIAEIIQGILGLLGHG